MSRLRVAILFGGRSAEHEVSLLSARNVFLALDRDRFEPILIGIDRSGRWLSQPESLLLTAVGDPRNAHLVDNGRDVSLSPREGGGLTSATESQPVDVVFPVLHGPMGEDGTVQGLLELAGLPYVGAGVLGSAVGMDKDVMKRLLHDAGLPITPFRALRQFDFDRDPAAVCARAAEVGFPLFTKPANLGSSVGVRRVDNAAELRAAIAHAFEFDTKALAEAAVVGREIEIAVLGNDDPIASVAGEIEVRHKDGFYSYDAKYIDESGAILKIPVELPVKTLATMQKLALDAFSCLECAGMARVDFFLRTDGTAVLNEINTIPGFTAISMYPKLWEASGIKPRALVTRLLELALERHARRTKLASKK